MKYGNEHLRKFKRGDTVRVREDLEIGEYYKTGDIGGDTFTYSMDKYRGREATVLRVTAIGYELDINSVYTFTEDMLEAVEDTLAKSDYLFNKEVEKFLVRSTLMYYEEQINKALDNRLFESSPNKFNDLVDNYKKFLKDNELIIS